MKVKQRNKSLSAALREVQQEVKGKAVDKRFTAMKTTANATKHAEDGTGSTTGVCEPTPDELALINEFTRSPKQAHEVVVFSTLSCNDLVDRDDEKFTTDTVKEFAALEAPYGPTGKSYMVGHDYTKLPVGRIFDTGTAEVDGALFLTNKVYIPNTESNKSMIENIDFGVNWAVSVGVMLDASECGLSFCGAPMYNSRFFGSFCENGHDKSAYYTRDAETDAWGYPLPCDPKQAGAEKCIGLMKGARDFYELSQVFLGAQFYAALEKQPGFKGVIKAASAGVPILGLSAEEAKALPMPHMDPRAIEAVKRFGARPDDEGVLKWTDDTNLVWSYNPADSEVMCLGKAASESDEDDEVDTTTTTEEEQDGTAQAESDSAALGEDDAEQRVGGEGGADDGAGDEPVDLEPEVGAEGGSDGGVASDDEPVTATDDDTESEEKAVSKAAVLKSLRGLKAPSAVLSAVEGASGDSLDAALSPLLKALNDSNDTIAALTPKAAMGDEYLKGLRSEALDWYVRANQTEQGKGVNTDLFGKMLDQCGDNAELIKGLLDMQKGLAQAKFPKAVRRSTFEADANKAAPVAVPDIPDVSEDRTVKRIHG